MNHKIDVLIGLQYGDEGKGKVVDAIAKNYDVMVRYQGGANSGHTVHTDAGDKVVFNQIPSGMAKSHIKGVIASGVVVDPLSLMSEVARNLQFIPDIKDRLYISSECHVTFPSHRVIDIVSEMRRADKGVEIIGSTCRGNTPTYSDKVNRTGVTLSDLLWGSPDVSNSVEIICHAVRNRHFASLQEIGGLSYDDLLAIQIDGEPYIDYESRWLKSVEHLRKLNVMKVKASVMLNDMFMQGERILLEGAQGAMLDIDHGTYPYVTSSMVTTANAFHVTGLPIQMIGRVYGVFKPYVTRVGSGFFPTKMSTEDADVLAEAGNEYGSVTGRRRRIGWLDLPALKYACMINSVTDLVMTKLDVLESLGRVEICTHYCVQNGNREFIQASYKASGSIEVDHGYYTVLPMKNVKGAELMSNLEESALELISVVDKSLEALPLRPQISMISVSADSKIIRRC